MRLWIILLQSLCELSTYLHWKSKKLFCQSHLGILKVLPCTWFLFSLSSLFCSMDTGLGVFQHSFTLHPLQQAAFVRKLNKIKREQLLFYRQQEVRTFLCNFCVDHYITYDSWNRPNIGYMDDLFTLKSTFFTGTLD